MIVFAAIKEALQNKLRYIRDIVVVNYRFNLGRNDFNMFVFERNLSTIITKIYSSGEIIEFYMERLSLAVIG